MTGTPFIIGPEERAALHKLRELAAERPVDMRGVLNKIATPAGKRRHLRQMTAQTIELPFGYAVTFSIETNHPVGTCRHMSISSPVPGRVPIPEAVWMAAQELGFVGSIKECTVWPEQLQGHGTAINIVQPIMAEAGRA